MENKGPYNQPPHYGYPNAPGTGYPNAPPTGYPHPPQTNYPHPPPPQAGFVQPTSVVVMQPQMNLSNPGCGQVGPEPMQTQCRSCHALILTNIKYEPTTKTHLMALCLCCFICWPCAWLPYCMESCQNANHYCPNCNSFLGTYEN